jgi:hypothetical protein
MLQFPTKIVKLGINPVVDPPDDVLRVIFKPTSRSKGAIEVRGRLNGADFIQTLVTGRGGSMSMAKCLEIRA